MRSIRKAVLPHPPRSPERREAARGILATEYDFLSRWVSLDKRQLLTVGVAEGLAFGAGAGLLQACAVRLVGKKFTMAMPEVRIGLIPDCGATRFYAKLPGCVGMFLAMTGARVAARDAVALGLADGAVADGWRGEGLEGVAFDVDGIVQCTEAVQMLGEPSEMADAESELRRGVDEVFSAATVEEVVDRLQTRDGEWAKEALGAIRGGAPKAVRETFAVMRVAYKARGESLREAVDRELEVECRLTAEPDFEEGVRAALVDKDGKPKWEPL